jgi:hypothetical protein
VASICAANLVGQWSLPAQEIPAELLRLYCPGDLARCGITRETPARFQSKLCSGEQKWPSSDAIISPIQDTRVSRVELMSRSALLCKSALFVMLFANRPVNECSEAISNPVSTE